MTIPDFSRPPEAREAPPLQGPQSFGTLSIVFGSLVLLWTLAQLGLAATSTGEVDPAIVDPAARELVARAQHFGLLQPLLLAPASAALIWVGSGQRGYRRWALRASLGWAAAGLGVLGILVVHALAIQMPLAREVIELSLPSGPEAEATRAIALGTAWAVVALEILPFLPYPLVLLWYFRREDVRAAMTR